MTFAACPRFSQLAFLSDNYQKKTTRADKIFYFLKSNFKKMVHRSHFDQKKAALGQNVG